MYLDLEYVDCYDCFTEVISPLGYDKERSVSHTVNILTKMTGGGSDLVLHSRDREYNTSIAYDKTGKGLSWEVWTMYSTHQNMFTDGTWAEDYTGSLSDSITDERNILMFMDLRHDITVYKNIKRVITLQDAGIGLPANLPQNSEIPPEEQYYDFVKFPSASLTITTTTSYHVIAGAKFFTFGTTTNTTNRTENIVLGFSNNYTFTEHIFDLNTPEYHQWEQYFIGILPNPEADGWDYFEPYWQDEYLASEVDYVLNELFRISYGYTYNGTEPLSVDFFTSYFDPSPVGSWAVDKDGNMFFSQPGLNKLITAAGVESDPLTLFQEATTTGKYYPIAPA